MLVHRCRGSIIAAALCALAVTASASDFYVSPTGSGSGNGALGNPWDLATALAHPDSVKPADTIYLLGGVYKPSSGLVFVSRLTGSAGLPITVRAYNRERARIDGGLEVLGAWTTFRDLEVFSSSPRRQTGQAGSHPTDIDRPTGFVVVAPNVKLINNIVHDAAQGIGAWVSGPNTEIYGNHLYFNGWKGPNRTHGHGIYAQNETGSKWVTDNIVHDQFADGLHIYASSASSLNGFNLEGNVVFNNSSLGFTGWYTRNILLGGGAQVRNATVNQNFSYYPPANGTGDVNLGYWPGGAGCTGVSLTDNYLVTGGRSLAVHNCALNRMTGNTVVGDLVELNPSDYPSNTYLGDNLPILPRVFVRPNRYEEGRATVVIYNWGRSPSVSVDLAGVGLSPGDRYELRNAQDYFNDVVTGTYGGSPIQAPMTGRSVAKPVGWSAPPSTFPEFGVFIVRKIGGASDTQPPTISLLQPFVGATLSGTVQLSASAADNVGIAGVEFQGSGQSLGPEDVAAPYGATLDTTQVPDGPYTLSAVARDQAGNISQSPLVNVVIENGGGSSSATPSTPTPSAPTLTAPGTNTQLGAVTDFQWNANGTEVSAWRVKGGSRVGLGDVFNSGVLAADVRSYRATNVPQDGSEFWIQLKYRTASGWKVVNTAFMTRWLSNPPASSAQRPAITAPGPNTPLGQSADFRWNSNGVEVVSWQIKAGPRRGSGSIFNSGVLPGGTTAYRATSLPQNGQPIWVHLRYRTSSGWKAINYEYKTNNAPATVQPTAAPAPAITSPAPGARPRVWTIFKWTDNGTPVTAWRLKVGSTKGGGDHFNSGVLGAGVREQRVDGMPKGAVPLYVRLRYLTPSGWKSIDTQYITSRW